MSQSQEAVMMEGAIAAAAAAAAATTASGGGSSERRVNSSSSTTATASVFSHSQSQGSISIPRPSQQHHHIGGGGNSSATGNATAGPSATATTTAGCSASATSTTSLMINTNVQTTATGKLTGDEARLWWHEQQFKVEKELNVALQKRLEDHKAQLFAFRNEQNKWQHELQLRTSKYAHDRKLLSEHNIELQQRVDALEKQLQSLQLERSDQVQQLIELEGLVRHKGQQEAKMKQLELQNDELNKQLAYWERFHHHQVSQAVMSREQHQKQIMDSLICQLEDARNEMKMWRTRFEQLQANSAKRKLVHKTNKQQIPTNAQISTPSTPTTPPATTTKTPTAARPPVSSPCASNLLQEEDAFIVRIGELEKLCKQKDHAIHTLKTLLERQQVLSEEKMHAVNSKYDHVKAINMALQVGFRCQCGSRGGR